MGRGSGRWTLAPGIHGFTEDYPFSNKPSEGKPRNFYDELRVKDLVVARDDVIRLQRVAQDSAYCIVDLVDLENVPAPLAAPANSL